jgi:hypothetical protein
MLRSIAFCLAFAASSALGAPLIELTTAGKPVQGRQLASSKKFCFLIDIDGRLIQVPLNTVTDFRMVEPEFKGRPLMEVKKALSAELGSSFEVAIRGMYVVAAPRGKADHFASLFDQTAREFLQYLRIRKFKVTDPDLPLIAVVYPTREQFVAQCAKDSVNAGRTIRGYYDQRSNRVSLYDDPLEEALAAAAAKLEPRHGIASPRETKSVAKQVEANSKATDSTTMSRETAMHEAIHQLAFNSGLHSRLGNNPIWVVEGLAMQFERGRDGYVKTKTSQRVSVPRLENFETYRKKNRQGGALAQMIASDEGFKSRPLDNYGEAWLFTNYLIETRAQKFGWYLQTLAARNPLDAYPEEERLRDFQANFGDDLAWLEVEYLRYAEKLAAEALDPAESKKR